MDRYEILSSYLQNIKEYKWKRDFGNHNFFCRKCCLHKETIVEVDDENYEALLSSRTFAEAVVLPPAGVVVVPFRLTHSS